MRVTIFGKSRFYESSDFKEDDDLDSSEGYLEALIWDFTKRKTFRELLDAYGRKNDLEGYIVLEAHGSFKDGKWVYDDDKKLREVQDWIDRVDGFALGILLYVCNSENADIHSRKSIVIHPKDKISPKERIRGGYMRIYVPEEGYLENSYSKIKKVLGKLKDT